MSSRHPLWLRTLNWTIVFLLILWIVYDRTVVPMWNLPLRISTVPLYEWLLNMAAIALLAGLVHLVLVHFRRVWNARPEWGYSLVLLTTCTVVVTFGLSDLQGVDGPELQWIYTHLIVPGEAALMAATLFVLAGAFMVMLRTRRRGTGWCALGVTVVLLAQMPWLNALVPSALATTLDDMMHLVVTPVSRGLLLGSGILITATVIHFLLGRPADRTTGS